MQAISVWSSQTDQKPTTRLQNNKCAINIIWTATGGNGEFYYCSAKTYWLKQAGWKKCCIEWDYSTLILIGWKTEEIHKIKAFVICVFRTETDRLKNSFCALILGKGLYKSIISWVLYFYLSVDCALRRESIVQTKLKRFWSNLTRLNKILDWF